jgi:hypothetical protein
MNDTLNQFRRRLAQINGIKLDEAASKPEHLTPEYKDKMKELQSAVKSTREAKNAAQIAAERAHQDHQTAIATLRAHQNINPNYYDQVRRRNEAGIKKREADAEAEHQRRMKTDPKYARQERRAERQMDSFVNAWMNR